MALHLYQFIGFLGLAQLLHCQGQQMCRQLLQRVRFVLVNVAAFILGKAKDKHPSLSPVGGNQCAIAPTLAMPRTRDSLFDKSSTQIGIHQALHHFVNGIAESRIGEALLSRPTVKPPGLVDRHVFSLPHLVKV
jgi:hypothetical protein